VQLLDSDRYPTQYALQLIRDWDCQKDLRGLVELLREIWNFDDYMILKTGKNHLGEKVNILELHCGGWSGNEDIIGALEKNEMFFMLYWQKTERGGHYYFELPFKEKIKCSK
jgi:hypothetical protein